MELQVMGWNDERVEQLKKLWSEGLSASQIASRLGGVTRNAVIGKVHRLGLSGRATTSRMKSHRPRPRPGNGAVVGNKRMMPKGNRFPAPPNSPLQQIYQAEPFQPSAEELDIPMAERKSIQTLLECHCRWPIGDPQMADFHFCGKQKVAGLPYCEFHARRAFQPPQARRRERDVSEPMVPAIKVEQATEKETAGS
jgi:GcrA cell cycle regulator